MAFWGAGHFMQYYGSLTSGSFYSVMVLLVVGHFLTFFFFFFLLYYGFLGSGSFYTALWLFY